LELKYKSQTIIIIISLAIILFTPITTFSVSNGLSLDNGWSFKIGSGNKIYYNVSSNLDNIILRTDRLELQHISGDWGLQYQGGNTNLTSFPETTNNYVMTIYNNATINTVSNNTVYWDYLAFNPKYIKIYDLDVTQINEDNFKLNYLAHQASTSPSIYVDYTTNTLEIKTNNSIQQNIIEISFQEQSIVPPITTVLPNNINYGGTIYLGIVVSLILSLLLVIYVIRRKT